MDFRKYFCKRVTVLDRVVAELLKEQIIEAGQIDQKLVPLLNAFAKSCQGGKRIRGLLVMLGYEIGQQTAAIVKDDRQQEKDLLRVAAAYEILHSAVLAHDDIIDKSLIRRGQHSLYQDLGGDHYGTSQAISLADYGFFLAFRIIAEVNFPKRSKIGALKLFSKVMIDTTWGELLDLENADPLVVMKLKTASYTVAGPLQMGAVLAGANQRLIATLGDFGTDLGIVFQIQDDILDGDVKSKKAAEKQAKEYRDKTMKILPEITKDKNMSKLLQQMVEWLVERRK